MKIDVSSSKVAAAVLIGACEGPKQAGKGLSRFGRVVGRVSHSKGSGGLVASPDGHPKRAPRGGLLLEVSSVANADFSEESWEAQANLPVEHLKVSSLAQAVTVAMMYRNKHQLGGGNWSGGQVWDDGGKMVARISYNGRAWEPGRWPTKEVDVKGFDEARELAMGARVSGVRTATSPAMAEAARAALEIWDGIVGLMSEEGKFPDRYWKKNVVGKCRMLKRGMLPKDPMDMMGLMDDLLDGLEGVESERADLSRYWGYDAFRKGKKALDELVSAIRSQTASSRTAGAINHGNVRELTGPGAGWKALVRAREKGTGKERFFIGTVVEVEKLLGPGWDVWLI